jgi:ADP-heptose:LPS heptosyltransferase
MTRVLCCRLDNDGDVLLTGPAVRAVAAGADHVSYLCGPRGRQAAALLPGVDRHLFYRAAWIDPAGEPLDAAATRELVDAVAALAVDEAMIFSSFHQSPLPTALLLRLAGVPRIAGISADYPGSLLDVRHRVADDLHEVERSLSLVATLGYRLPPDDDGRLAVRRDAPNPLARAGYVVVHPGASVPARAWAPERYAELVDLLRADGWEVVVTGGPAEADLTRRAAGPDRPGVTDLGGRTSLDELAGVLADAAAVVVGNTGPAHLAAAVGTPVVSLYAPTVPSGRWAPWGVACELLGEQTIACAGCRASRCPLPGHPCLDTVPAPAARDAVRRVLSDRDRTYPPTVVMPA